MIRFVYKKYSHSELDTYFSAFKKLVTTEFPIYSHDAKEYMLNEKRGWSRENWEKYHENKYRHIYGAWVGDHIAGILMGSTNFSGVAFLEWLMIDLKYQKKGAGTFLVREFEKIMKEKGQHAIHLWSEDKNRAYYEKLGYKQVAHIPNLWFGITT